MWKSGAGIGESERRKRWRRRKRKRWKRKGRRMRNRRKSNDVRTRKCEYESGELSRKSDCSRWNRGVESKMRKKKGKEDNTLRIKAVKEAKRRTYTVEKCIEANMQANALARTYAHKYTHPIPPSPRD